MRTAERTASFARSRLSLHVVGEFVQFLGGDSQGFRRVLTDGRNYFVVQVLDELGGFLLDSFRRVAYGFVHARGCVLDLAVEIVHESFGPRAENCRTWQPRHYFLAGATGQSGIWEKKLLTAKAAKNANAKNAKKTNSFQ